MNRLDRLPSKLVHLIGCSNIKLFFQHPTYLQVIAPLLGIFYFMRQRGKIMPVFYPFLFMIICGLFPILSQDAPRTTLLRLMQLLLLVGFSHFVATYFDQKALKSLLWTVMIGSFLVLILEMVTGNFPYQLKRFGLIFPRSAGIVGEPNFSGIFYLGLIMIGWCAQLHLLTTGLIFSLIVTLSRGSLLALLLFFFLIGLHQLLSSRPKIFSCLLAGVLALLCSYPLWWILLDRYLAWEWKVKLVSISARYYLHVAYIKIGITKLLGHGYMFTPSKVADFIQHQPDLKLLAASSNDFDYGEQHNFFLQIFSDFGPVAYFAFCLFLFFVFRQAWGKSPILALTFVTILANFLFLNGGNELIFYLLIGIINSENLCFSGNLSGHKWRATNHGLF